MGVKRTLLSVHLDTVRLRQTTLLIPLLKYHSFARISFHVIITSVPCVMDVLCVATSPHGSRGSAVLLAGSLSWVRLKRRNYIKVSRLQEASELSSALLPYIIYRLGIGMHAHECSSLFRHRSNRTTRDARLDSSHENIGQLFCGLDKHIIHAVF